jgi:hypothetical protein
MRKVLDRSAHLGLLQLFILDGLGCVDVALSWSWERTPLPFAALAVSLLSGSYLVMTSLGVAGKRPVDDASFPAVDFRDQGSTGDSRIIRATRRAVDIKKRTRKAIRGLHETVDCIDEAARSVEDVAMRTNLIALTASIEAGRGGESGGNYSTMAAEVRSMAAELAGRTGEINEKIEHIRHLNQRVLNAMNDIGQVVADLEEVGDTLAPEGGPTILDMDVVTRNPAKSTATMDQTTT